MVLAQKTFSVRKNIHGKDGAPALTLAVIPSQLIFDTDESGAILTKVLSANTAKVGLYDGQTEVTAEKYDVTPVNCTATLANGVLTITSVTKGAYSGRVDITAIYKGKTRVGSVAFNVNANHVYEAKFEAQEKAIEAVVSDTAIKEDGSLLSKVYSMFKMLSDKIRLFVTDGLKRAGIEITSDSVNLMGNKVKVTNNDKEASLFENGKLNANFIDAKKIVAEGVKAQVIDAENATFKNINVEGTVKADNGYIGRFSIVENNLVGTAGTFQDIPILVVKDDRVGRFAGIGFFRATSPVVPHYAVAKFESDLKRDDEKNIYNTCVYISASGANSDFYENNAIYIRHGCIKGFRLAVKRVNEETYYIDKMDTFLVNRADSADWYLPSDCEDGQSFYIVPSRSRAVTIHTAEGDRLSYERGDTDRKLDGAYIHQFVYDAENHYWYWGWQN